jgi:RNA polymerase sigma-B factor
MMSVATAQATRRPPARSSSRPSGDGRRSARVNGHSGVNNAQRQQERDLLCRYATTRSHELRERLVMMFAPLARSLAGRYRRSNESFDDLVQVANLALLKAIDGFDPARGRPFTAYAVPTILGELRRHFRDNVWTLRLPRSLQELTMEVEKATSALTEDLGRSPTVAEIAEELEIAEEEVLEALTADAARRTTSLDAPRSVEDGEGGTVIDTVAGLEPGYDRVECELASETAGLDEREQEVLRLRFGEELSQSEIGKRFGVSQMQISRIQRRALHKLLDAVQGG